MLFDYTLWSSGIHVELWLLHLPLPRLHPRKAKRTQFDGWKCSYSGVMGWQIRLSRGNTSIFKLLSRHLRCTPLFSYRLDKLNQQWFDVEPTSAFNQFSIKCLVGFLIMAKLCSRFWCFLTWCWQHSSQISSLLSLFSIKTIIILFLSARGSSVYVRIWRLQTSDSDV